MKAGLLSGVFDPVHLGHLHCARQAARLLKLDMVYFVPTAVPPHKRKKAKMAGACDRYAMTQLALLDMPRFAVLDIEMGDAPSYTINTIRKFKRRIEGEPFFIMGMDAFADIHNWRSATALLRSCNFIVISRPGTDPDGVTAELEKNMAEKKGGVAFSRRRKTSYGFRFKVAGSPYFIHVCLVKDLDISSTAVRERLGQGKSIGDMVPETVRKYIRKTDLY